jgi:gliding motility-associated-like protein
MLKKTPTYLFLILLMLSCCISLHAQLPIFLMPTHQNTTVTDCKGEFHDSDAGPNNTYLAQASDTFHICTGGTISMSFQQFQLENGFDTIFFYDGPTINNGALIGAFTGSNVPTGIVANGWSSTVIPPVPPTINFSSPPLCNTTTIDILLNKKVHCDSVLASSFSVAGIVSSTVIGATAIGCAGDSTNSIQLHLSQPLNQNCNYTVTGIFNLPDNCDSIWTFMVNNSFTITDCPLTVNITATPNDTVCSGGCTQLQAVLNSCLTYNYFWSNGLSNAAIQSVCPLTTTTYTLGVQSTSGGPIFNSSITITVLNPQITPPAQDTVCQSDTPFNLVAFPSGGIWSGLGITDSINGTFDPDTAMQGVHFIYYKTNGFCKDSFAITVLPMDAGLDEAACPGSPAFTLSGYSPVGGSWSGYIRLTPSGVFTPDSIGVFTAIYTHPNGCSDFKQVYVQSLVVSASTDSICESLPIDTLIVSPPGGRWIFDLSIIDTVHGVIDPGLAGAGMHDFYYKLNGCMDTAHVYIKPIFAGYDFSACPLQPMFTLTSATPVGGIWSSIGTNNGGASALINTNGDFNPGIQGGGDFTDTLVYTAPNGCPDTVKSYVSLTNIITDSLTFCLTEDSLILQWETVKNYPWGGVWIGTGVVSSGSDYYFNPSLAGVGIHTLTYLNNTCSDTMRMVVYPSQLSYQDATICSTYPAFILDSISVNANWQGTGITDTLTGLFDPSVSGVGVFPIVYSTPSGCTDTITVTVYQYNDAQINNLDSVYCYKNFDYPANFIPSGGTFTGPGVSGNSFNPAVAGPGQHQLIYSYGIGFCYTSDTLTIMVDSAIQTSITASNSSICKGGGSTITISASGGNPDVTSFTYSWSNGLFPTTTNVVSPTATTTYYVNTSDGCSDDKLDSVTVAVYSSFYPAFTTSPISCNGTSGTASVSVTGPSSYSYQWSTAPVQTTSAITAIAGSSYSVKVTDINSGCFFDTTITIPGYGIIHSLFSINPNLSCIPYEQGAITFIDLSLGATQGYWELSDGTTIPYVPGQNPEHTFAEPGTYTMKLHVENSGNCSDEYEKDVCVLDPVVIFIPDIFSPNGDGLNDILYVRVKSVSQFTFTVYDRWGEKVFETNNPDKGWDGRIKSGAAEQGVYVWYLSAKMADGTVESRKGDVTLVR